MAKKVSTNDFINKEQIAKDLQDLTNLLEKVKSASVAYQSAIAEGLRNISQSQKDLNSTVKEAQNAAKGMTGETAEQQAEMKKLYAEMKRLVVEYDKLNQSQKGAKASSDALDGSVASLEQEYKRLTKEAKAVNLQTEEGRLKFKLLSAETSYLKKEVTEYNKTLRTNLGSMKTAQGSYNELTARNKELAAAIRNTSNAFGKQNPQLAAMKKEYADNTSKLKKFDAEMNLHFRNVGNYSGALKDVGSQLLGFSSWSAVAVMAIQGISNVIRDSVKTFTDFEYASAKVKAISGATADEFARLNGQAKQLGASTEFTATQVSGLQLELSKLGFKPKEIQEATAGILDLASATGEDLASSAAVAATTLRGFGLDTSETNRVTDLMARSFSSSALDLEKFRETMKYVAPVAKAAGVSIEDTTAMVSSLADAGISGSSAGTALRRILSDMSTEGKTASEAIAELADKGITMTDAMDEVGRSAQTALLVLADNTDKTAKLSEQYKNASGSAKEMADIMRNTTKGAFDSLSSATEGLYISIGEQLAPVLVSFLQSLTGLFQYLNANAGGVIGGIITKITEFSEAIYSTLTSSGFLKNMWETLTYSGEAIYNVLSAVWTIFSNLAQAIFIVADKTGILWTVTKALSITFQVVAGVLGGVGNVLSGLSAIILEVVKYIADWVDYLGEVTGAFYLLREATDWISGMVDNIKNFGSGIASWTSNLLGFKKEVEDTNTELNKTSRIAEGIGNALSKGFKTVKESAGKAYSFMSEVVTNYGKNIGLIEDKNKDVTASIKDQEAAMQSQTDTMAQVLKAQNDLIKFRIEQQLKAVDDIIKSEEYVSREILQQRAELKKKLAQLQLDDDLAKAKFAPEIELAKEKFDAQLLEINQEIQKSINKIEGLKSVGFDEITDPNVGFKEGLDERVDLLKTNLDRQQAMKDRAAEVDKERQQALNDQLKSLGQEVFDFTAQLINQGFENRITNYEAEIEALDEKTAREIELAEGNEQQQAFIREEAERKKAELEEKIKQQKLAQFRFDKALRIGSVAIDTASGIMKSIAQLGLPAAIPFVATTAAIGAIQLASIIAQKPPQFAEGTTRVLGPGTETSDDVLARLSKNERVMDARNNRAIGFDVSNDELVRAWKFYERHRRQAQDFASFKTQTHELVAQKQSQDRSESEAQRALLALAKQDKEEYTVEAYRVFARLQKENNSTTNESVEELRKIRRAVSAGDRYKM